MIQLYARVNELDSHLDSFDVFLSVQHLLYVRRDVIFRPLLPEREEVVEALHRVLWKILHPQ